MNGHNVDSKREKGDKRRKGDKHDEFRAAREVATEPVPDLDSLLEFGGYNVRIDELAGKSADEARGAIVEQPQFRALFEDLAEKGYRFPEGFRSAELSLVSIQSGELQAKLRVGTFQSEIRQEDGTLAAISVALDQDHPERSLFMGHMGNVYGLEPGKMPKDASITFNGEPLFTVNVAQVVPGEQEGMQVGAVTWFRYWWYDSHHHKNWWYGAYAWYWRWYLWHARPWWWWYNWWWGWYHWRHWWFWSRLWAPVWIVK